MFHLVLFIQPLLVDTALTEEISASHPIKGSHVSQPNAAQRQNKIIQGHLIYISVGKELAQINTFN